MLTALGRRFTFSDNADCLYLHDLAVARQASGSGIATALINEANRYAKRLGCSFSALISFQNSVEFWQRHGYVLLLDLSVPQRAILKTCGDRAFYMRKVLDRSE